MRTPRAVLVSAVVAATTVTTAALIPATATAAEDPYPSQKITWGDCAFKPATRAKPAQCAEITVPRDWANPAAGIDLKVSISRVAATGDRQGAILVNPGGPGGQGTSLAGRLAGLEPAVNAQYDFIGMDPRGTGQEGSSDKGLLCQVPTGRLPGTALDARDRSAASIAAHQATPRAIAEACQSDALTPYITTWQTTHDMDLIRTLLGDQQLDYLGYSYGTWLGAKYASMFPDHAGKIVLDSSVNFEGRLQADFEAFPEVDQRQFNDVYVPWLSRQFPDQLGKTPEAVKQKYEQVRAYYAAQGLSPDNFDHIFVGNGSKLQWLLGALVFTQGAAALDGTAPAPPKDLAGDLDAESRTAFGVPAADLTVAKVVAATPDYAPVGGTRYAVACGDQPTRSAAWYKNLSDRQGPVDPLYGWSYGLSEPCGYWSEAPQHELPDLPASVASHVLVVQGEFDPQTGYEQGRAGARAAGVPLISVDDAPFHGEYAINGNPCVDGLVNTFLTKNSRPASTTCPGVPLPGEDEVHPVAGPVDHHVGGEATEVRDALSLLRQTVQDLIRDLNSGR
ncbi:alpha/beta fold hydrolase [Amycolatopsis sp. NPDC023774]|uniref:alpha/beta fold hydrolase n=1 Tax=Amycolatopsis sp. NPDC023774 TaxID=3155015 RepID=UPI0033DDF6A9